MRVFELVVEPDREEHLARHGVTIAEAEEVVFGNPFIRRTRQGRFRLIGQTSAGRFLTVFVAPRGHGVYGLVTAREATQNEHRLRRR